MSQRPSGEFNKVIYHVREVKLEFLLLGSDFDPTWPGRYFLRLYHVFTSMLVEVRTISDC